jgi:PAS domain S-box-containing protein
MWNQAAEELFGMKSEDVIGKTDYDFYPKEQADAFRAADIEVVRDRKRINIPEEAANNAKGETRILQTVKVPVVDENDQPVLLLVVTADVTEVKQAQDTIAKRARELEKVASVSTSVSTIQTPDEMLQTVVDLTKESFDLYHAHIYLFDEAEKMLVLTKGAGEVGRQMVAEGRKIALGAEKSLVARAARSRQGVTVNDVRQDPDFLPHPLLPETRSEMAVPMIAGDRLLGVIDVQDEEVGRFSQEDINILTTLAAQVAISLQNARSYARAQRQAEREALINIISERIQATNSVETALQVAVREIGRALGAQHTAIRLGLERKNTDQS